MTSNDDALIAEVMDASGLACPLPLLKAKQALARVEKGDRIKVLATDKGSVRDFHSFVELSEHSLISFYENDAIYTYIIQKA